MNEIGAGVVRCKFHCIEVTKRVGWNPQEHPFLWAAKFQVVTSGSEENKAFFAATPSGSLEISTIAQDMFEVGKDYFVDLSPAWGLTTSPV